MGQNSATITVETRSRGDLPMLLDVSAVHQVEAMVSEGWESTTAAAAWLSWVGLVAQAAADMAVAETSWKASTT